MFVVFVFCCCLFVRFLVVWVFVVVAFLFVCYLLLVVSRSSIMMFSHYVFCSFVVIVTRNILYCYMFVVSIQLGFF